jgi:hypothetical protein
MLSRLLASAALLAAGCALPRDAASPPSEAALAAPPPRLAETARFDAALASATPDAERLAAGADALAARAEALRARAAALAQPVLAGDARDRLDTARR